MKQTRQKPVPDSSGIRKRIVFLANFAYSSAKLIVSGAISCLSAHPDVSLSVRNAHPADSDLDYGTDPGIDGIISCISPDDSGLRKVLSGKRRLSIVFVSVAGGRTARRRHAPVFYCDDAEIGRAAASLLLRHDLTEFAVVGTRMDSSQAEWAVARRDAFVAAVTERGCKAAIYKPRPAEEGDAADTAALAEWLRSLPRPCGLFVCYDQRAMAVLEICRANAIAVPEQIQVVSVDNETWICEKTSPTLTSIEPDFEGAGYRAAEALLAMMGEHSTGKAVNQAFGVKRVVQRMSTTDIHGHAGRAVRARDYIAVHAAERISLASIAQRLNCSVRTLQTSYRKVFGITVSDEMAMVKVALAQKLLAEGATPIEDIPELVGYETPRHFKRVFRARTGMTMSQFRRAR